jgi:hypothetical protein
MRAFVLSVLFLNLMLFSAAQNVHVGVMGGISNYQGDLVNKLFTKSMAKGAGGISVGYELSEHWTLRGGLMFTKLYGNDKYNTKTYLQARNLSFSTSVTEFSVVGEYATFNLDDKRWTPYVFGGLAMYHFDPYAFDSSAKMYLKALSTEGEGLADYPDSKPYGLTQLAIPFGGGLRFAVSDNVRVGVELGIRKLFTDHLDDVSGNYADAADLLRERSPLSVRYAYRGDELPGGNPTYPEKGAQRGGSSQKDWYYVGGLTLSFRLGNGSEKFNGGRSKRSRGYGCPASPL